MNTQLESRLVGGALLAAPVLLLATTIIFVTGGGGMNNSEPGGAILVWAMIAFAVGLLGLVRHLEPAAPRGAALLRGLVVVGCAGGVGFGIDSIHAALPSGVNLLETDAALVPLGLAIPGMLFPVAVAATGIALARAGVIGRVSAVLFVAGAVLFPASRVPDIAALAIAADVLLVVGVAPVGAALLARSSRDAAAAPAAAAA